MKKSEWFIYNAVTERATPMEMAVFTSIMKAVKPNKIGSAPWNSAWKQFPEYSRAMVDYLKDPAWWPRVNKVGDKVLANKQNPNKKPYKKMESKKPETKKTL